MPARTSPNGRRRASSSKRPVTPEDLLRLVFVSDPQISPDGTRIVFAHKTVGPKNEYRTNLWIVDAAGGEPRPFTAGGRDSTPRWSDDGERIAFVGARDKRKPQIYVIAASAGGGEARAITKLDEGSIGTIKWSPDGTLIAFSFRAEDPEWTEEAGKKRKEKGLSDPPRVLDHWWYRHDGDGYFNNQRFQLHVVDVASGATRVLHQRDTLGFFSFDFSPDSRELIVGSNVDRRAGLRAWNDDLLRVNVKTRRATRIKGLPSGPKDGVVWSPDGKWIAFAGREGADPTYSTENLELWICRPDGREARSLTAGQDSCLAAGVISDTGDASFSGVFRWSPDSSRIYTHIGWHGEQHLAVVPLSGRDGATMITEGPRVLGLGNLSADGRRAAITVATVTQPPEVHLAELSRSGARTTPLTNLNGPLLAELAISAPKEHWVKSADGTPVHVWMMRPPGKRRAGRGPAVLEIHGGPHTQYGLSFFLEFQVLASAGYTVFYSNPRGSKGYGRDHCAAIRGAWGGADWRDIQAVIGFMKSRPEVDPKRMGIMGGSYGGYMTNWAVGHCSDFAAAITDRCVSNLVSMWGSSDFVEVPDLYWPGCAWERPEALWDQSPIKYMGKVKAPMLIIHSEGDLRCNIEQAEQVYAALCQRGIRARFIRYPRSTSHGMSRSGPPDMRLHRMQHILKWWSETLQRSAARPTKKRTKKREAVSV